MIFSRPESDRKTGYRPHGQEDVLINMGTLFYHRLPSRGSWSSWLGRPLDGPSFAVAGAGNGAARECDGGLRMREVAGSNPAGPICFSAAFTDDRPAGIYDDLQPIGTVHRGIIRRTRWRRCPIQRFRSRPRLSALSCHQCLSLCLCRMNH